MTMHFDLFCCLFVCGVWSSAPAINHLSRCQVSPLETGRDGWRRRTRLETAEDGWRRTAGDGWTVDELFRWMTYMYINGPVQSMSGIKKASH